MLESQANVQVLSHESRLSSEGEIIMSEMEDLVASVILLRSRSVMDGPNYPSPDDCAHVARAVIAALRVDFLRGLKPA